MPQKNKYVIAFSSCIFFTYIAASQNIDSTIINYASQYGQERIYLHYDKSSYGVGETIWFKAYLQEGISPAIGSKTLYIDWTDETGNLLYQGVCPLQNATASGQFDIPNSYKGSFIHVKAYTKWMLNFDSAFLYEKDIRIIQDVAHQLFSSQKTIPTLTFFPEGGDAVANVKSKIAFKANDQWGQPVQIQGVIINSQDEILDSLKVIHDGMGYFFLVPKQGESYFAKWVDIKGNVFKTALPAIKTSGVSLQVNVSGSKRNFFVYADQLIAAELGNIHLIGTMYHSPVFNIVKDISNGEAKGVIPVENLPTGILTITVFDKKWIPIAERITFVNNDEYRFQAAMNVTHLGLDKRAMNEVEINVPDSLYADFSVSVTDADIDTDSSSTIISNLLLTCDLKGQVFNPAYYFSANTEVVHQHLDLVMLTHGWRRFNWEEVVKGVFPTINFPKDTSYLGFSGKVNGKLPTGLKSRPHIILFISQTDNQANEVLTLPIEENGNFGDPGIIIIDTARIYYQLSKGFKDATVQFMNNRLSAYRNRITAKGLYYNQSGDTTGVAWHYKISDALNRLIQEAEGKLLENVIIKAKTKTPMQILDEKYASGMFQDDGQYFDLLNDKSASSAINIFMYLQGKVAGLLISNSVVSPSVTWRREGVQFYLDEMAVGINFILSVSVSDIAYIKAFRPPFFGNPMGNGGAIAIYTRKEGDFADVPGKGKVNNTVIGYSIIRQFYSPDYSNTVKLNDKPDLRTTLYWNPHVTTTPQNNNVKLTFYNNDVSRSFRVIIEGMTLDGQLCRIVQIME